MRRERLKACLLGACALFLALLCLPWGGGAGAEEPGGGDPAAVEPTVEGPTAGDPAAAAPAAEEPPVVIAARGEEPPPPRLGEMRLDAAGRWVAPLGEGRALLTIDPGLQRKLTRVLADYRVPWGATVLLEPRTGRVLAMAEHSEREKGAREISLRAIGPAASVFKIVTAAALLERGVEPDETVCYHGGKRRLAPRNLADDPRRDRRCLSLSEAMGHSANVVFAKLADRGLGAEELREEALRWLFNAPVPFAWPVEISRAEIPDDPFAVASAAAGFGQVRLSALHAALIAAAVANGGLLVLPELVDGVEGAPAPSRPDPVRVVEPPVAEALARMMTTTTTEGTARRIFRRDRRSRRSPLREVTVAGKTGSLSEREPFRDYSWFVGFAPADDPQVAVATVIVNERLWRIRAPWVAHHALETFFAGASPKPPALALPGR